MKRTVKTFVCALVLCVSAAGLCVPEDKSAGSALLLQGYEAFRAEDWVSALFFFRKAVNVAAPQEESLYMLILSEMFAEDYGGALGDCDWFVTLFPGGTYYPLVLYQRGRALYYQGSYDEAVAQLTEFCHLYPAHEMYPSALFWIAESFFFEYNYSAAKVLYERLVSDFPRDAKAVESQNRLRSISQYEREEKLLYLLKVVGEEYLAAKESYEKELKQYRTEDKIGLREQLRTVMAENEQLKDALAEEQRKTADGQLRVAELERINEILQASTDEAKKLAVETVTAVQEAAARSRTEAGTVVSPAVSAGGFTDGYAAGYADGYAAATQAVGSAADPALGTVPAAVQKQYPEIDALKRKAAELQRLLDKNSNGE
ncbi:tetratricopeptide repeat protein [Treponema brennaborense]|uniref:Tetratricopeptide TPR_2 repeat-containing protein n=1 Tax=Treponema brennaborense (strain DSM 12168 / CIP 105900 / DD5/3) TaxID=906968 RepID=F4LQE2_TREBD|nr:tetratricopeptide repeat protein [Treponema brennaborense]AEE17151.1 Tetratricopeptide TPR_2 repeat-containing protein [Treponema brennaborense DSM 12168]